MSPNGWIDAHHHVWRLGEVPQPWIDPVSMAPIHRDFTIDDLRPLAAASGFAGTVVVQTVNALDETVRLLAQANEDALMRGVVGWVDLTVPSVGAALEELKGSPGGDRLVGIRHVVQDEPDPHWLDRKDVLNGLRAVAAAGLSYDLLVFPHQLPAAANAVRALPQLTFVLDHLGKPPIKAGALEPWETMVRELGSHPNVYAKLSGLVTEADWNHWRVEDLAPYCAVAIETFGVSRLIFGSDWPVCTLAATYASVVGCTTELLRMLAPHERDQVFGDNARCAYRLATSHAK